MTTRILIADDDAAIRLLLRRLLENHASWEVCGEASNGKQTLEKASRLHPDLIILDLAMPVSVHQITAQLEQSARQAGFRGAVTKSRGPEVVAGIEALLRGEAYFIREESSRVA